MTDRPVPKCPGCGNEMELQESTVVNYWYSCDCGWSSPLEDTPERAYAAATRTPPNKPMTLPELFDLADDDAAWVVTENGKIWAMGAECAQEWASEECCLFFASKPTNADIAAARKEQP